MNGIFAVFEWSPNCLFLVKKTLGLLGNSPSDEQSVFTVLRLLAHTAKLASGNISPVFSPLSGIR